MRGGTVWGYEKKGRNAAEQPNTDVWKVEKCYTNPKTLVHNWHETRAKAEHESKPGHKKFLVPQRKETLPTIDKCNRAVPPSYIIPQHSDRHPVASHHKPGGFGDGILKEARTDPYKHYLGCHSDDTKCDVGSERNPVMPTKLAPWHHINKTNYVPPDDNIPVHGTHDVPTLYRFPMSVEQEDPSYRFPYPKEVIYATPENYGYMVAKKKEWDLQEDDETPQWGNERQRNSIYRLSYREPCVHRKAAGTSTKPFIFRDDIIPPSINDSFRPYKGVLNNIYSRHQTTSQLGERLNKTTAHLPWRAYDGVR